MWRIRANLFVLVLLVIALLASLITGLALDVLVGHKSMFHRYSAYAAMVLIGLHLCLSWKTLCAWLKAEWKRIARPTPHAHRPDAATATPSRGREPAPRPSKGQATGAAGLLLSRRSFLATGLAGAAAFFAGRWTGGVKLEGLENAGDLGQAYHQWSKPSYVDVVKMGWIWGTAPSPYKDYRDAQKVLLPQDFSYRGLSVEEALERRRSVRDYSSRPMPLPTLSRLLHYSYGVSRADPSISLRTAPSGGAQFPAEIYPVVNNVEGIAPGVYHYAVREHALELVRAGDFRLELMQYGVGQDLLKNAAVVLVLTAIFQRSQWRYKDRAYRYVLLDTGHVGQNIYLAATSLGLGPCGVGAFFDDDVNRLLGVDGKEEAVTYLVAVGML